MTQNKQYDHEYKVQAIKLAREIGSAKAAAELGVPKNTMYGWMRAVREGRLDIGKGAHMPQDALTLNEELINLRTRVKQQEKEIKRLKAENEFLEEASAFFAASRRKVSKKLRLKFIAVKTDGGRIKGNISFYCRILKVSREAFRKYLINKDKPWKYKALADEMRKITEEDEYKGLSR